MIPMEVITMIGSTVGGAVLRMWSQTSEDKARQQEMILKAIKVEQHGYMQARRYDNPQANWIRRFLVISFMSMAGFILLAPLFGMNTVVPVEVTEGFKFLFLDFTNTVTKYVTLEGVVTPEWLGHSILSVVGMYFGSSIVARR